MTADKLPWRMVTAGYHITSWPDEYRGLQFYLVPEAEAHHLHTLDEENARLRVALEEIAGSQDGAQDASQVIARKALDGFAVQWLKDPPTPGRFLTEAQAKEYIAMRSILKRLVIDKENAARDEAVRMLKGEK